MILLLRGDWLMRMFHEVRLLQNVHFGVIILTYDIINIFTLYGDNLNFTSYTRTSPMKMALRGL